MGTEMPQRPPKEAAGSRHEPGLVRQTAPASTDPIGPQTQTLPLNSGICSGALEPPCTEPYARWCGRTGGVTLPPTRS